MILWLREPLAALAFNRPQHADRKRFKTNPLRATRIRRFQYAFESGSGPGCPNRWARSARVKGEADVTRQAGGNATNSRNGGGGGSRTPVRKALRPGDYMLSWFAVRPGP